MQRKLLVSVRQIHVCQTVLAHFYHPLTHCAVGSHTLQAAPAKSYCADSCFCTGEPWALPHRYITQKPTRDVTTGRFHCIINPVEGERFWFKGQISSGRTSEFSEPFLYKSPKERKKPGQKPRNSKNIH